tara:strand:+ start:327 stop:449 length:123 start_codon:yes stop_codon:yes gene_type:complete
MIMEAQLDMQHELIRRKLVSVNEKYNEIARPKGYMIVEPS